jgi:hypothetical protein
LPEYAGPAAHYCDPLQPESIAQAIRAALEEPVEARRAERIAYGLRHTPETVGERASQAIEAMLATAQPPARPRLAWFAQLRPPYGVPRSDLPVLAELSRDYAIEIVCQPRMTDLLLSLRMEYPLIPANRFAARHEAIGYSAAVTTVAPGTHWLPKHRLPEIRVHRVMTPDNDDDIILAGLHNRYKYGA